MSSLFLFVYITMPANKRRILLMLMGIWIISAFDLILTISAHNLGILEELNPIARHLVEDHQSLSVYKIALVSLWSWVFWRYYDRKSVRIGIVILFVIYFALAVYWHMLYFDEGVFVAFLV